MYFRDARNLTAKQRQTLDRFMARDCDETGKKLNYTASNGERPSISTPATNVHVHLHDDLENGPPRPPAVPSTTSGREPGLPNNDPLDDVQEQLAALNVAVATLATAGGYDPGDDGQVPEDDNGDDTNNSSFTNDPTDGPDITSQIASQHVNSTDELPDIADINEKNRKFWAGSTSQSVTGGGDIAINSQGTPGKTDNGIDVNRRLSTGTKRLDRWPYKCQQPESLWHHQRCRHGEGDPHRGPGDGEQEPHATDKQTDQPHAGCQREDALMAKLEHAFPAYIVDRIERQGFAIAIACTQPGWRLCGQQSALRLVGNAADQLGHQYPPAPSTAGTAA